jgi:putative ATP-binding cassette transporter
MLSLILPLFCNLQGKIQLGVVNQAYGAFSHILSDLSLIVNQFESLSQFSAGIDRLGEFMERMDADAPEGEELLLQSQELAAGEVSALPSPAVAETIQLRHVPGAALSVENLSVVTPGGTRQLVTDVSFRLDRGERLLIVGESGTGKSSLLRALSGLWTRGSGHVVAPSSDDTFFLPQKPYCTTTRLRDQITYPQRVEGSRWDDELLLLLQKVGLGNLASLVGEGDESKGLRTARDWGEILSLGEQQRLAFARLMFNRPMLAYMVRTMHTTIVQMPDGLASLSHPLSFCSPTRMKPRVLSTWLTREKCILF